MSITPTAIVRSASPRPYALAPSSFATVMSSDSTQTVGGRWVCTGHMTIEHNPTTTNGSKRLGPGFLAGVLT